MESEHCYNNAHYLVIKWLEVFGINGTINKKMYKISDMRELKVPYVIWNTFVMHFNSYP